MIVLRTLGLLLAGSIVLSGCAGSSAPTLSVRDVSGASCAPLIIAPAGISRSLASAIPAFPAVSADRPERPDGLSPQARQMAEIIGVLSLIRETRALETAEGPLRPEVRQRLFDLRQYLSDRMMTTFFEVSSVAGQIDCEAIRANHVANALSEIREERAQRYEVTAIVGDALIGIVGGALTLGVGETAAAITEIFGGDLAVGFGLAAGFTGEKHDFQVPRNYLHELWVAPSEPTVFPDSVWRFLNWPRAENVEYPTRRQELIAEWRDDGFIAKTGKTDRRTELVFGSGGIYEIEDLHARAQMLEELKTYINGMVQLLHLLSWEVLNNRVAHAQEQRL